MHIANISTLVEQLLGFYMLIIGLSMLIYKTQWVECVNNIGSRSENLFIYAMVELFFGLLIVLLHPDWSYSYSVLVTIFAWSMLFESTLSLLLPNLMVNFITSWYRNLNLGKVIIVGGLIMVVVGAIILLNVYHVI